MILSEDEYYFVLPNGLGDTLLFCYINGILEEKLNAKIVFCVKESHAFLLESFELRYMIKTFSKEQLYTLAKASSVPQKGKLYVAHPTYHDEGELDNRFLEHKISFIDMYAIFLGVKIDKIKGSLKKYEITDELREKIARICGTDNISEVILFAPEMNSGAKYEIIQPFWANRLYEKLREQNKYIVYNTTQLNFGFDNQIQLGIKEIVTIGMHCKRVVTSRSGLADILYGNVNFMQVIYPNRGFYDLFRLDSMWEKSDSVEEIVLDIGEYLQKNGFRKICLYGYGEGGKRIRYSLEKLGYAIEYAVDKVAVSRNIKIYRPDDKLPPSDVMIICVNESKESIKKDLNYQFAGEIKEMKEIMESLSLPSLLIGM